MIMVTDHPLFDEIAYAHIHAKAKLLVDETNRVGWEEIIDGSAEALREIMKGTDTGMMRNSTFIVTLVKGTIDVIVRDQAKH